MTSMMRSGVGRRPITVVLVMVGSIGLAALGICALSAGCRAGRAEVSAEQNGHDDAEHPESEHSEEALEESVIELDEERRRLAGIRAVSVTRREMGEYIEAPAVLHANPDETAVVSPSAAGVIESVTANVGDTVRQGQALITLRSSELAQAQAEVLTAAAELEGAEEALRRRKALAAEGTFSSAPYEGADRDLQQAQEDLRLGESTVRRLERLVALGAVSQPPAEEAAQGLSGAREAVRQAEADRKAARTALATARSLAGRLAAGPGAEQPSSAERPAAEAKLAGTQAALEAARVKRTGLEGLLADGLATEQETRESAAEEATAASEVASARLALRLVDRGLDEARLTVTNAEQELARSEASVAEAQARLRIAERRAARQETIAGEDIPAQQRLAEAKNDLEAARATFEQAQASWQREKALHAGDLRSLEATAELESAAKSADASLRAAERTVSALGQGTRAPGGRLTLRAPLSGKISSRLARKGAMVEAGAPLLEIVAVETIWVEAAFYEKDLPLLAAGQEMAVEIAAFPGETFATTIHSIDPGLDEHTRKATVRGLLRNPSGRLLPDMFANVRVRVGVMPGVVAVPEDAVQSDGHCEFVFVEEEPGHYCRVEVQTGSRSDGFIEIQSGLNEGQLVVSEGAFLLKSEGSEIEDTCGH